MTSLVIFRSNILASAVTTAMSPELQSLETLKKESLQHCLVLQRIEKIRENHVRQYDEMKQKQHETLVTVMEASLYLVFVILKNLYADCGLLNTSYLLSKT